MKIICGVCGIEIEKTCPNKKYCKSCYIEKQKALRKKWGENNKERYKVMQQRYYLKNRDKVLEKVKEYKKDNYEKVKSAKKKSYYKNHELNLQKKKEFREKNINTIREQASIWRDNNREKLKEYGKIHYIRYRDKIKKKTLDYKKRNPDKVEKWVKDFIKNNPEKIKMYRQKSYKNNLEKYRKKSREERAKRKNVVHKFTSEEWILKLKLTKGICPYCGEEVGIKKLTLDHIYPIKLANEDYMMTGIKKIYTIEDVQPLCMTCNCSKSANIQLRDKVCRSI